MSNTGAELLQLWLLYAGLKVLGDGSQSSIGMLHLTCAMQVQEGVPLLTPCAAKL
jgi:hypothetical protein